MFNKSSYEFRGIHGDIVVKLTSEIDEATHFKLFARNIDVLFIAPIVGYLYQKREEKDMGSTSSAEDVKKINMEQLMKNADIINFNYELIMLLHEKNKVDIEERLNRAFRYSNGTPEKEECEKIYESYILGGLSILKEKLLDGAVSVDDYMRNIHDFIEEYNDRYVNEIKDEQIFELFSQK